MEIFQKWWKFSKFENGVSGKGLNLKELTSEWRIRIERLPRSLRFLVLVSRVVHV